MTWMQQLIVFVVMSLAIVFLIAAPRVQEIPPCPYDEWCPPSAGAGIVQKTDEEFQMDMCLWDTLTFLREGFAFQGKNAASSCNHDDRPLPEDPCDRTAWLLWLPPASPAYRAALVEALYTLHCPTAQGNWR